MIDTADAPVAPNTPPNPFLYLLEELKRLAQAERDEAQKQLVKKPNYDAERPELLTADQVATATETAVKLKAHREAIVLLAKPLAKVIGDAEEAFRHAVDQMVDPMLEFEEGLRARIKRYQQREHERQQKEAAARAVEAAKLAASGKPDDIRAAAAMVAPVEKPATIKSDRGAAAESRITAKWELVDITKVPAEYTMTIVVRAKIDFLVSKKGGSVRSIPGLRIWEDVTPVLKG